MITIHEFQPCLCEIGADCGCNRENNERWTKHERRQRLRCSTSIFGLVVGTRPCTVGDESSCRVRCLRRPSGFGQPEEAQTVCHGRVLLLLFAVFAVVLPHSTQTNAQLDFCHTLHSYGTKYVLEPRRVCFLSNVGDRKSKPLRHNAVQREYGRTGVCSWRGLPGQLHLRRRTAQ